MDASAETSGQATQKQQKKRTRRGKRKKTTTTTDEHAQTAPVSAPLFDFGVTTSDPMVTWAMLSELSIQRGSQSEIREAMGLPKLADQPYQLGQGPRPALPPWSFFPAAPPQTVPPTAVAPSRPPQNPADASMVSDRTAALSLTSDPDPDALAAFDPDMDDLLDDI